jgi:hexosaminidase
MSRRAAIAATALALAALPARGAEPPIVPIPASVKAKAGALTVTNATALSVEIGDVGAQRAAANFADLVGRTHGLKLRVRHDRPAGAIAFRRVRDGPPEAYRIEVTPKGAVLAASTEAGFSHATASLWQLLSKPRKGAATLPAVQIDDAPRFAWRGVMLDSARHFQSPDFIRRFIDWMALHKLNVLHWHLTDDQAWRLEILKYPRLAQVGGWRVPAGGAAAEDLDPATGTPRRYGGYYSQATVRALVNYAAERGITIVPEIEMPGHASAAIVAYPQLAATSQPPTAVPADWGVYRNAFNVDDATFAFLEDVLREVMALFPSPYIHVGGDEVEKSQWKAWPAARARMREIGTDDPGKLQVYFTQRIALFLRANGRRLVGWDEILEPGLPPGAVVMSWRGTDGARVAAARGHDTIVAAHPTLYFDNAQAISPREPPGRGRVVTLEDVYEFEPMLASIPPEQRKHVLGVQANVWTEHIRTEARVAWMAFPRAAAVAEIGWSMPERRGWDGFHRRMQALDARYASVGLRARPLAEPPLKRPGPLGPFRSHDLELCTEHISLALEDDAPITGTRPSFYVDVMNPCWILPAARLDRVDGIAVSVGQVPFNFQVGDEVKKIRFPAPTTPEGELEVRIDGCSGELVARLPLAPATLSHEVTALPAAPLAPMAGRHDLCLRFAQPRLDPIWVIDTVRLLEGKP